MSPDEQRAQIRRALGWILVGSLCLSALVAIAAIAGGDFDDTDWRVIGSSIGFAIYSAVGATGASLRLRASEHLRGLVGEPDDRAPEIRREAEQLRELARTYSRR